MSNCKGLSFIDWESLDEEEFLKLNEIINSEGHGAGVQFPFSKDLSSKKGFIPLIESTDIHQNAPVYSSQVPPPSVENHPMPTHWPSGNMNGHYPVHFQDGYTYHNSTQSVDCEVQDQTIYGITGHTMTTNEVSFPPIIPLNNLATVSPHFIPSETYVTVPNTTVSQPPPGLHINPLTHVVYIPPQPYENISSNEISPPNSAECDVPKESEKYISEDASPENCVIQKADETDQTNNMSVLEEKIPVGESVNKDCAVNKKTFSNPHSLEDASPGLCLDTDSISGEKMTNAGAVDPKSDLHLASGEKHSSGKSLESPVSQQTPKSWSSLFAKQTNVASCSGLNTNSTVPQSTNSHFDTEAFPSIGDTKIAVEDKTVWSKKTIPENVATIGVHNDPLAHRLLDQINDLQIVHTPIVIQPRGLKNGSNTCFLNAPLQVLMGCSPFVHLFRSFKHLLYRKDSPSSTPVLDSLVRFVNSFQNGQRIRNLGSRNKKMNQPDLNVGQPFIPDSMLNVAQNILGLHIGVQHDAEEFLSQVLSVCNDEMEKILKMGDKKVTVANEVNTNLNGCSPEIEKNPNVDDDDEAWQQVGPKNHYVETNVNDCGKTPISAVFAGLSRSCLTKETGKSSDTLDSFFTLKLDIQSESVQSVKEALFRLNTIETVHDADGRTVHGQRRMYFDVLPHVLIMHLKLFEYSNGNGQKIQKKISYDVDLSIPKEIISRVGKMKYASPKSRHYKLFGVVNHHGCKMNDGHYTSDVFLPVASGWLRFDDSNIQLIEEEDVLYQSNRSMPYLLFYRRTEFM